MAEDRATILATVYKHYIVSKIMSIYGYVLKDNLPNNHLEHKSAEITKSCVKFYKAFDKKIALESVEAIEDMSLEYFEAFDLMMSLTPEDFATIKNQIKKLSDHNKWKLEKFQEEQSQLSTAI